MESSSVWYNTYRFLTDELGYKSVTLSNPYLTKAIAASKKKTDKIDAKILADLLRGEYIATCYVPNKKIVKHRQLVRYRKKLIQWRTALKNSIHGILLQEGIKIPGVTFTITYNRKLMSLGDYRIDGFLRQINYLNLQIAEINSKVYAAVKTSPDAILIKSIPGIGDYSSLVIASEIADIARFNDSHKLAAYAGVVPSVRNSADTIHHGSITKRGSMTLRWVLTQCVHAHAIHAKDSDITKFYNRIKKKRGSSKAAVATSSKILRVIYWMLKERREFVQNYS
jgi:transposase